MLRELLPDRLSGRWRRTRFDRTGPRRQTSTGVQNPLGVPAVRGEIFGVRRPIILTGRLPTAEHAARWLYRFGGVCRPPPVALFADSRVRQLPRTAVGPTGSGRIVRRTIPCQSIRLIQALPATPRRKSRTLLSPARSRKSRAVRPYCSSAAFEFGRQSLRRGPGR